MLIGRYYDKIIKGVEPNHGTKQTAEVYHHDQQQQRNDPSKEVGNDASRQTMHLEYIQIKKKLLTLTV